jgi:hypothetical protein
MKLLTYTIGGQKIGIDIQTWDDAMLSGNTAFMAIADTGSTPTDYVDISTTVYWDIFGGLTTLNIVEIKNEILKLIPNEPTAQEYEILEGYMNVGIDSMTNVLSGVTFGSVLTDNTILTGVTDNKLSVFDNKINDELIFIDKITGTSATFLENLSVDGQFNMGYANQMNSTQDFIRMRYNAFFGIGDQQVSGFAVENFNNSGDTFLIGVDNEGIMKVGVSGTTLQPVATGSTTGGTGGLTTYNVTNPTTITTTSTSDVLMTGIQINSVPAGNYFLSFGTSLEHSANSDNIYTNIYVGGVPITGSEQHWRRGAAQGNVSSTHNYSGFPITLATTATIEIRWRSDGATASAANPYMTLIKVG